MMDTIAGILTMLIIFGPFVLIIIWAVRYQKRLYKKAWDNVEELFNAHKIKITSTIPVKKTVMLQLTGQLNNNHVNVYNIVVGSGKSRQVYTKTEITLSGNSLPEFTIYKENIFSKLGEMLGHHDIKTGDEEFDKTFRLKSWKAEEARTLTVFNDLARIEFLAQKKYFVGNIEIKQGKLTITILGVPGTKMLFAYYKTLLELSLYLIEKRSKLAGHAPN